MPPDAPPVAPQDSLIAKALDTAFGLDAPYAQVVWRGHAGRDTRYATAERRGSIRVAINDATRHSPAANSSGTLQLKVCAR